MYRSFLPVEPDEVRNLRPETTPPHPKRLLWRGLFSAAVLIGIVGVIQATTLVTVDNACTAEQQAAWDSLDHLVLLDPQAGDVPGCGALFETALYPGVVLDHYASALEANGWTVTERQDEDPSFAIPTPAPWDGPAPSELEGVGASLDASRDEMRITVVYDRGWSADAETSDWKVTSVVYVLLSAND